MLMSLVLSLMFTHMAENILHTHTSGSAGSTAELVYPGHGHKWL